MSLSTYNVYNTKALLYDCFDSQEYVNDFLCFTVNKFNNKYFKHQIAIIIKDFEINASLNGSNELILM
jgi:hypothetical protein